MKLSGGHQRCQGSASPACARSAAVGLGTWLRPIDLDLAQPFDRVAVGVFQLRGCLGPRRQHDRAHVKLRGARRRRALSSVWLIVPNPGLAAISNRQPERDGEIAHGEAPRRAVPADRRHPRRSESLHRAQCRFQLHGRARSARPGRSSRPRAQPQDGARRRAVAQRRDLLGCHARDARQQLVVRRPSAVGGLVQAGHDGLVCARPYSGRGHRREQRRTHDTSCRRRCRCR